MPPKTKPAPKPAPAAPKPTQAVRSGREMAADFEQDGLKALERRNWEKAADGYMQAMELWEKYKEPLCLSRCAARLGEIAYEQDDFAEALAQFSRQADFARKHKERAEAAHPLAVALYNVGLAQFRCGHFVDAEGTLKQAYEQARGVEDALGRMRGLAGPLLASAKRPSRPGPIAARARRRAPYLGQGPRAALREAAQPSRQELRGSRTHVDRR